MKSNQRPKSELTRCNECTLQQYGYVPMQEPSYPQFPVLFYGEAPGTTEDVTGLPFTGVDGKILWRLLKEAGLNKSRLYLSNICGCVPLDNRKPTPDEVACCHARIYDEIQRIQPELIVALGDIAAKALTNSTKIRSLRGQKFPLLSEWDYDCQVLCVLHPGFVRRQRQWIDLTIEDLKQVVSFFTGEHVEVVEDQPNFIYEPNQHELSELFEKMSKTRTFFDIETPGELNTRKAALVGISFCAFDDVAIAFDFTEGDPRWETVQNFLEDVKAEKGAQNGSFDVAVLETHNIIVQRLTFDTKLAEHTISSDMPLDLDFLRSKYTKIKPYKPPKRDMKKIGHWDSQRRLTYGCWDAFTTQQVAREQMKIMTEDNWRVLNNIDLPLIPITNYMTRKGMLVDVSSLALLHARLLPQLDEIREKYFDPLGLNPNSPVPLAKYLDLVDTEADTLKKAVKRGHPNKELIQALLEYREMSKVDGTFLIGVYNRLEDGRVHTNFNIAGTGTGGRLSSDDPNLQNVPKHMRVIYIADEGYYIVEGDYSQLELTVGALLAPEPTLLQEIKDGKKVHHMMGRLIFNKEWDELTDQQKLREKAVVFGTLNLRGARSIAMEFDVPIVTAEEWQSICINKYPGFADYYRRQTEIFQTTGKCYTPFGRVRTIQTLNQAANTPIQSCAGDITKTSLIELAKKSTDLRLTVHDSIAAMFHKSEVQDGINEMKKVMERPIVEMNGHSFPAKFGFGKDWYNLKEV